MVGTSGQSNTLLSLAASAGNVSVNKTAFKQQLSVTQAHLALEADRSPQKAEVLATEDSLRF